MNIKIEDVAKLMGKDETFIRIGIQSGLLPIGTAIKSKSGRYNYYVSPKLFEKYTGIKISKILESKKINLVEINVKFNI